MPDTPSDSPTSAAGRSIFQYTPDGLRELLGSWGEAPYRAKQVLEWVYQKDAAAFADMTNLTLSLRTRLAAELPLYASEIANRQQARDGTVKLLLRWADRATTECVMIPAGDRRTVCVSTQVGCPVGCRFCASGIGGLQRQLSIGEIVEQVMRVRAECGPDARLSNVVFMGLGEPLANYDATVAAVRIINADWGLGIGARKITVSTVGLPDPMRRLADEQLQITLALSLHAPNDELRGRIIPWAGRVALAELVDAARYYFDRTGREITIEYVLLGGVNDSPALAVELAKVVGSMRANVNLIRYNPVAGLDFQRPSEQAVEAFCDVLSRRGVNVHVRRSRGAEIEGACGQLRRREEEKR